jgi:hypothetical protein
MRKTDILDKLLDALDRELAEARKNDSNSDHLNGKFEFGRHEILFFFDEDGCEIEINRKVGTDFIYLDNVAEYCQSRCIGWDDVDTDNKSDIWDEHGFSDESDYIRYRYG